MPDPNTFGGPACFISPGQPRLDGDSAYYVYMENSRGLGVADMTAAIQTGRSHRADGDLAYHMLDVMQAFVESREAGKHILIESTCERPAPLPMGLLHGQIYVTGGNEA